MKRWVNKQVGKVNNPSEHCIPSYDQVIWCGHCSSQYVLPELALRHQSPFSPTLLPFLCLPYLPHSILAHHLPFPLTSPTPHLFTISFPLPSFPFSFPSRLSHSPSSLPRSSYHNTWLPGPASPDNRCLHLHSALILEVLTRSIVSRHQLRKRQQVCYGIRNSREAQIYGY